MQFTLSDLENLSNLARIHIKNEEKEKMLYDMQAILQYVSEINNISLEKSDDDNKIYNVVREDIVREDNNSEDLLKEAPKVKYGYVEVIQVLK